MNKYDIVDPWDKALIEDARATLRGGAFCLDAMDVDPERDDDCWDFAISFNTDGQYQGSTNEPVGDDSFGPWGGKKPEGVRDVKISASPKLLVDPSAVILLQNNGIFEIQFYSEKVDESLKGCFVARIWNHKTKREVGTERFYAPKLSWVITAAWEALFHAKV